VELVTDLLGSENGSTRSFAADALGEIGDARAVESLFFHLTRDSEPDVRRWSGLSLYKVWKKTKEESVPRRLRETTLESEGEVRLVTFDALLKIDKEMGKGVLRQVEQSTNPGNDVREMRRVLAQK
jgi:HEAT repeat protein